MSEPTTCMTCGQTFGASWGDVSGECWDCRSGNSPKKLREKVKDLEKEEEVAKLKEKLDG